MKGRLTEGIKGALNKIWPSLGSNGEISFISCKGLTLSVLAILTSCIFLNLIINVPLKKRKFIDGIYWLKNATQQYFLDFSLSFFLHTNNSSK